MLKSKQKSLKPICAIQTRINSSRFPEKCFAFLAGKPLLQHVLERCLRMNIESCYLLVPITEKPIFDGFIRELNLPVTVFGGSETDVLARYANAALFFSWEGSVMRVTADNPLISVFLANQLIQYYSQKGLSHYLGNPLGTGVELFTVSELLFTAQNAIDPYEREHVTPYFYRHPEIFNIDEPLSPARSPLKNVSVDTPADLRYVENILAVAPNWGIDDFTLPEGFINF